MLSILVCIILLLTIYPKPQGLTYFPNALPTQLLHELTSWLSSSERTYSEAKHNKTQLEHARGVEIRRTLQFGFSYVYTSGEIVRNELPLAPILRSVSAVISRKAEVHFGYFNQCIVNRYLPGQGIAAHIDHSRFGETIACVTVLVGNGTTPYMVFRNKGCLSYSYSQYTENGSLYVMKGDARYEWKHEQPNLPMDGLTRYSVTFRHVE